MADPDDPTYDPPDRAITRADDKAQAARDAENHEGGRNDQWAHPRRSRTHHSDQLNLRDHLSRNHTSNNADYGIEAQPGTVIDGGGNASSNDPSGCLGVTGTYH